MSDDARHDARLTEWELMMFPRYRGACEALVARPLAVWGHRGELRVLGRTLRRATIVPGSMDDWHRARYLNYLTERRRRAASLAASMLRLNAAVKQFGVTVARAAEQLSAVVGAWGASQSRKGVPVDH